MHVQLVGRSKDASASDARLLLLNSVLTLLPVTYEQLDVIHKPPTNINTAQSILLQQGRQKRYLDFIEIGTSGFHSLLQVASNQCGEHDIVTRLEVSSEGGGGVRSARCFMMMMMIV